jgi:hypothetical protein
MAYRLSDEKVMAVRVRREQGESMRSIGLGTGRSEGSIDRCTNHFNSKY